MEKKLSRLTTEQRYDLVAYLDGELDAAETDRIEKLIAGSQVARGDVELLAATYELLSELPRPKAGGDFTERTMATARLEEVKPDPTRSPIYRGVQRSIPYIGWIALLLVAGCVGFAATRYWVPRPHDMLVDDFEIIHQLDKYTEIDSIDFLERLSSSEALMTDIRGETRHATPR
jgi:anti-sigma factor RsiW